MTDSKAPSTSNDDPTEDSPFGRDYLSDSDNEFLAELDRVLESEAREQMQVQAPVPAGEREVSPAEPEVEPEGERTDEPLAADTPQPQDDEAGAAEESGEQGTESAETSVQVDASAPFDEQDLEEVGDSELLEGAVGEEEMAEPAAEALEADTELLTPAARPPEPLFPEAEQKPVRGGESWIPVGAAALLGLIGITLGGVGLWQAGSMEERLIRLESATKPADVPKKDPAVGVNAERIGALEQRIERELSRLNADLKGVKAALNEKVESEKAQLTEDLSGLSSTLTALQSELKSAEEMVAEADERLQQVEEPKPLVAGPPKQQEPAAPGSAETAGGVKRTVEATAAEVVKPAVKAEAAKAMGSKSGWAVNLWSFQRREKAAQELARIREQEIPAEIFTINNKGKLWHRIAVGGFDSYDEANAYAKSIRSMPGLESAWVGRF